MNKPISTPLPKDLPENWQLNNAVTPSGTDAGLSEKHGYNYLMKQVNASQNAINQLNDAFVNVQETTPNLTAEASLADADTFAFYDASANTARKTTWANILAKLRAIFAPLVHTHGNITNDGKLGTTANQVAITDADGTLKAGTAPILGGGTGASSAAGARTNLGADDASNLTKGTLSLDRLPTIPVAKGGTGVTDLNINKLKRDTSSDTLWQIYLSPNGNDSNTGLTSSVPMKTIRAAVGKYGGLNRLQLMLAAGTYTDAATVVISGSQHVTISGIPTTAGSVVITHPIIFQSADAYLYRVTIDLSASTLTDPCVTFRQSKYNVQECVFKGKNKVHAGINASVGSSGYVYSCTFQDGQSGAEIGSGASMTALNNVIANLLEIGFNVNGGMLLSGNNTNNAFGTQFTMYNSAVIFNDGILLNSAANVVATAELEI